MSPMIIRLQKIYLGKPVMSTRIVIACIVIIVITVLEAML